MKAVLMSIKPKWCELIANGKKTIEVRKTRPKLETPFKCYIYTTKGEYLWKDKGRVFLDGKYNRVIDNMPERLLNGKVIGEFVCDRIGEYTNYSLDEQRGYVKRREDLLRSTCMTLKEWRDYIGNYRSDFGYAWHISDLLIYDKPKELSEFYKLGKPIICEGKKCEICGHLKYMQVNSDEWDYDCDCQHQLENYITVTKPPQSWCYVNQKE